MIIDKKYIILFWIIGLILFTFYCIFRLKYISETNKTNEKNKINKTNKTNEKYTNITIPITTQSPDIISYINTIQKTQNKITDIPVCKDIYDDNYNVQELGYNNCNTAYTDYLQKNLDMDNKYGRDKSLADICPVSIKSKQYSECLQALLNKYTDNSNILDNINVDMNSSINKRLQTRSGLLDNIQLSMNSFIYNKNQNDFNNIMLINNQIPKYQDDILGLVNNYYQDRYKGGIENFTASTSTSASKTVSSLDKFTNIVDSNIENTYFGKYQPIKGQFLALNDLIFSIEYDSLAEANDLINTLPQTTKSNKLIKPILSSQIQSQTQSKTQSQKQYKYNEIIYNKLSNTGSFNEDTFIDISKNTRPVLFTLRNNDDLYIIYKVVRIEFYKLKKNAIKLILTNKRIINQTNENNLIEPLLSMLGINSPSTLIMVFDEYTSTENIKHNTFKLVNDNLDTILVLEKLNK